VRFISITTMNEKRERTKEEIRDTQKIVTERRVQFANRTNEIKKQFYSRNFTIFIFLMKARIFLGDFGEGLDDKKLRMIVEIENCIKFQQQRKLFSLLIPVASSISWNCGKTQSMSFLISLQNNSSDWSTNISNELLKNCMCGEEINKLGSTSAIFFINHFIINLWEREWKWKRWGKT
jgi:hypothetical protein